MQGDVRLAVIFGRIISAIGRRDTEGFERGAREMVRSTLGVLATRAFLVVVLVSACSGEGGGAIDTSAPWSTNAATTPPPEAATLRLSDFPAGWMAEPHDIDDSSPCVPQLTPVAEARSEGFSKDISVAEARNTVFVFATADEVRDQFVKLREQKVTDCFRAELAEQVAEGAAGEKAMKVTDLQFGPISTSAAWGDEAVAFQSKISLVIGSITASAYTDLIFVRVGRVASLLVFSDVRAPFDDGLRDSLIVATAQRMQAR